MANKRMFTMKIVDSDAFLDMPLSTQCLYFHLCMRADDDGFISNPKRVTRLIGCNDDDMNLLITKKFVLYFENGVIVIKHWKMHNYISKDRYTPTAYQEELSQLSIKENKSYTLDTKCIQKCIQDVHADIDIDLDKDIDKKEIYKEKKQIGHCPTDVQKQIGNCPIEIELEKEIESEKNIKKNNKEKHKYGNFKHVLLTDDEFQKLQNDYPNANDLIEYFDSYIEEKGYKSKSHYLSIKRWVVDAVARDKPKVEKKERYEMNI